MGKASRNRRIRREAAEIAADYGKRGDPKSLARLYRKLVVQHRRRKSPSKPNGPTVWRWPRDVVAASDSGGDTGGSRRFRDRLLPRQGK